MEERETETLIVETPDDKEILELVDAQFTYPGPQSSKCAASPVYRCPYRRYKDSLPRKGKIELLSEDSESLGRTDRVEILELVDPNGMYPEARYSECTAPSGYRCAYRQYNQSLSAAQVGTLNEPGSGFTQSQPLRYTPKLSSPVTGM